MKIILIMSALVLTASAGEPAVSYTRFLEHVRAGEVAAVKVTAQQGVSPVEGRLRDGRVVRSVMPGDYSMALALFEQRGVNVEVAETKPSWWNAAPFGVLALVWLVLFFGMKKGALPGWRS